MERDTNSQNDRLRFLPRSIRWRIQLGLMKDYHQGATTGGAEWSTTSQGTYLKNVALNNENVIRDHRMRYEKLAEKHIRQSSALAIINDTSIEVDSPLKLPVQNAPNGGAKEMSTQSKIAPKKKSAKVVVDDPLSIMASMEENKLKADKEKEIERKREYVLSSRPHMQHHPASANIAKSQGNSRNQIRYNSDMENGSKTRWDDFYSSKDTIELIEKDLDRMPIDHHIYFHQRKTKTMMSIHDEDWNTNNPITMQSRSERSKILSEVLFVYAKEHAIGYRQGMHEILSYILMTIEMDLLEIDKPQQDIVMIELNNTLRNGILNGTQIVHDAYCMFDATMAGLSASFEYGSEGTNRSFERMGDATMTIIKDWHGDDELADFVSNLDAPPELYCTRWIRLMFSREVAGFQNVFCLWDEFFHYQLSNSMPLLKILETAAACMVILIQDKLIRPQLQYYQHNHDFDGGNDEDEPMHLLMNYTQIDDIAPLISALRELINNQMMGIKTSKISRSQSQGHPAMPMNNYMPPQMSTIDQPHVEIADTMYSSQGPEQSRAEVADTMYYSQGPEQPHAKVADTIYYSQGPINYPHPSSHHQIPTDQTNSFVNNTKQHQEQLISTFKNLKAEAGPAIAKLSIGLNAFKGALQSIDIPLKPPGDVDPSKSNNIYQPPPSNIIHTNLEQNDVFGGYRDLTSLPSIFDEQISSPAPQPQSCDSGGGFATEGTFVGGHNNTVQHQPRAGIHPPVQTYQENKSDISNEIVGRMSNSISVLAMHLQSLNDNTSDAWKALSELESIQSELTNLYHISPK